MKKVKIILLSMVTCIFVFNGCATQSKEIIVYKGKVDLELGDYCMLSGRILEKKTKKPLIGANIIIIDTPLAAGTDKRGSYLIEKIPPGIYDIKVSYIGLGSFQLSNFNFEKSNYYLVDFELLEEEPRFHILESAP